MKSSATSVIFDSYIRLEVEMWQENERFRAHLSGLNPFVPKRGQGELTKKVPNQYQVKVLLKRFHFNGET